MSRIYFKKALLEYVRMYETLPFCIMSVNFDYLVTILTSKSIGCSLSPKKIIFSFSKTLNV